ncbi:uncharacterized protein LOC128503181 [Spea bombifrons]|uniref:uncharacterized protein LOC128503181 n=1 Tax=Spea bombifrons TaxID=233779 RepID=UPI002349D6A1|nr:uncharacterized protein LOC128503181 [Spea bombifrons]
MPKSCALPECKKTEGKGVGYYKFPLQDKVRLKQWLLNMNTENFIPTKNQYLCSKHFKPSCFQYRWGVRFLKPDAVPTIFPVTGGVMTKKCPAATRVLHFAQNVKNDVGAASTPGLEFIGTRPQTQAQTEPMAIAINPVFPTGQIFIGADSLVKDVAMASTVTGAVNLVPLVHFVESFDGLSLTLTPSQAPGLSSIALPFEVTGENGIPLSQPISFITEEQIASTTLQHDLYAGKVISPCQTEVPTILNISNDGTLVIEDVSAGAFSQSGLQVEAPAEMSPEELANYLETMQTATAVPVLPTGPLPPLMPSETVLSNSITGPISSTVPIVSKHATLLSGTPAPQEEEEEVLVDGGLTEALSTPELLSIAVELQKKVKTLQQRHRRNSSKLEVLEGVVEQLKKENVISDEKLNFLEVASVQSGSELPETHAFTIVCRDDERNVMYALPADNDSQTAVNLITL